MIAQRRLLLWYAMVAWVVPALVKATEVSVYQDKTLVGRLVKINYVPASQLRDHRHPVRQLGKSLRIGPHEYRVEKRKEGVFVARTPSGEPGLHVKDGVTHTWEWNENSHVRKISIRFLRDRNGSMCFYRSAAVSYKIKGIELRLYDANCDGRFDDVKSDVFSSHGSRVAVPLGKSIVLDTYRLEIRKFSHRGLRMSARITPILCDRQQKATLSHLNRIRARHGLPQVDLDLKLSRACESHARYLTLNRWTGRTNPHRQERGAPGASEEGERAARRSCISKGSLLHAVQGFLVTYYHRIPFVHPTLLSIGMSPGRGSSAIVDAMQGTDGGQKQNSGDWRYPIFFPSDGSIGCETRAGGELPKEPVSNLGSRGLPIMAVFRDVYAHPQNITGSLELVKGSKRRKVPVLMASPDRYSGVMGIIPEKPLKSKTTYRATISWKLGGKSFTRSSQFTTR